MEDVKLKIQEKAHLLGFDLVGFSKAKTEAKHLRAYEEWLKNGNQGQMKYMEKTLERKNLNKILSDATTVISLAVNYYHEQEGLKKGEGRIARYAYGRDYHKIIGKKLRKLCGFIETEFLHLAPGADSIKTKAYVDTGPVLDRAFAEQAGLGEIGKNSCLITQQFGSWVFLCEIITNLDIVNKEKTKFTKKSPFSVCGTCTRCIDACPTKAIISPGVIDARKCIAYQTIENKEKIPTSIQKAIKKHQTLFGCDICQEICPHNCRAKSHNHQELNDPKIAGNSQNLAKVCAIRTDQQFLQTFAGSPLMRTKRKGLQRNAAIIGS